jgi:hypothetical protein
VFSIINLKEKPGKCALFEEIFLEASMLSRQYHKGNRYQQDNSERVLEMTGEKFHTS